MSEDPPPIELWVLLAEAALVLLGAWVWEGGVVRWGEFLASWALTTSLLAFVAGAFVPWTRGVPRGGRALLITLTLGASGAVLTAFTMAGILVLSVIRTGLSTSGDDLHVAIVTGMPSGAWLGAFAGLASGAVLAGLVLVVEGVLKMPPNPERPVASVLVPVGALACAVLAGVAEVQHWAPASLVTGCSAGCLAWTLPAGGRILGSGLAVVAAGTGVLLLLHEGASRWRGPLGVLTLMVGFVALALGHTVFTSTTGPRFRRATLGLPPMPVPLSRELVDATVVEHPGVLLHTVEARWPDGASEVIIVGLGPFRPDVGGLSVAMQGTASRWQEGAMPGRRDEAGDGDWAPGD